MGGAMTKVLPGLFVGGLENAKNEEELIANCISHILVIQAAKGELEKQSPSRQCFQVVISERDSNCLLRRIPEVNTSIHRARTESGNVLICSESGISTNVAVVAAYLMTVYGLNRRSAVSAVQGLRHFALPIPLLVGQLDRFDATTSDGTEVTQSSTSPVPTGASGQAVTAETERKRLKDLFGDWPGYEEDLQCLLRAITSFKSMSESDLILRDTDTPLTRKPDSPVCDDDVVVSNAESHMTSNVSPSHATQSSQYLPTNKLLMSKKAFPKLTPPSTPPSTPILTVDDELLPGGGGESISTLRQASTSASNFPVSTTAVSEAGDCSPPTTLSETDLFPDDAPLLDVDEFASRYVHQKAAQCGSLPPAFGKPLQEQSTPPFEVGIELTSDAEVNDDEDDDVPGAIDIRHSLSHRQAISRKMAASYHIGVREDHRTVGGGLKQNQPQPVVFPGTSDQQGRDLPGQHAPSVAAIVDRLSTTVPTFRSFLPF